MSAAKDAFTAQAERGLALIGSCHEEDVAEVAANLIADVLHAVAQEGYDFRKVAALGVAWAEEGGADLYALGGVREGTGKA